MLRGLYTAAAGMITQQRVHDTITNNIANLQTAGFKQGNAATRSFPEVLVALRNGGVHTTELRAPFVGRMNTGVMMEEEVYSFHQGDLMETYRPYDLALLSNLPLNYGQPPEQLVFDASGKHVTAEGEVIYQPQAFFTLRDANNQVRYTLDGRFSVNEAGELVNADQLQVLDRNGNAIRVDIVDPATGQQVPSVMITERGELAHPVTGESFGIFLGITRIENPHELLRQGNGLYSLRAEDQALATWLDNDDIGNMQVKQGFIERSNVDATQSVIDMNVAARAYEANQKIVQFYDKSLERAVNEVGRV